MRNAASSGILAWMRALSMLSGTSTVVALASLALAACGSSGPREPTTLHAYLVDQAASAGVDVTAQEVDCMDRTVSDSLRIPYPASWSAYLTAMKASASSAVTADPSQRAPDGPWNRAWQTCLSTEHLDEAFAASLTATKISTLTAEQRACLIAEVHPLAGSIPADGVDPGQLRSACGIPR